jgi:Ni/Co efflux regulator RcnB
MKKIISGICASALIATTMAASAVPANAAGLNYSNGNAHVQFVAKKHSSDKKWRFEKRGKFAYLNGHRGDRHRHAGWREYNGYWFPPTAFVVGAFITGAIINGILNHH